MVSIASETESPPKQAGPRLKQQIQKGLLCPQCLVRLKRVKGRPCAGGYNRRRECPQCGKRFTTKERIIGQDATKYV